METTVSEKELFEKIARGDEAAFRVLFDTYKTKLYYFILKIVDSESAAEEMVQETFTRIWVSRNALDRVKDPATYLFIAAKNRSFNHIRRTIRDRALRNDYAEDFQDFANNAEEEILFNESRRLINEAVASLAQQQRRVYELTHEEGFSRNEIAERLGISPNTVKNHLVAAIRAIRDYLIEREAWVVLFIFLGALS